VLSKGGDSSIAAVEFTVKSDKPFDIEFEWPSERFVQGCKVLQPQFTLAIAKQGSKPASYDSLVVAKKQAPQMNNADAKVTSGAGKYVAFLKADFPHGPWVKEMVLNTFAAEAISFTQVKSQSAMDVFIQMTGMCGDTVYVKGFGTFKKRTDQPAYGIPTFWREKKSKPLLLFWNPHRHEDLGQGRFLIKGDNTWKMTDTVEHATKGRYYKMFDPKTMVSCSPDNLQALQEDSQTVQSLLQSEPEQHIGFVQEQLWVRPEEDSIAQSNSSSLLAANEDEAADCAHLLDRLEHLNNVAEIRQGLDKQFPMKVSSIGGANEHCGDSAAGNGGSCAQYDTWHDFGEIGAKIGNAAAEKDKTVQMMDECIDSHPEAGKCVVHNHCKEKVKMVCDTMDSKGGQEHVTHHVMNIPAGARGKASSYYCGCQHLTLLSFNSSIVESQLVLLEE
jgi:hypothetical protein